MSATALKPDPTPAFVLHHHYRRRSSRKCISNGRKSFGDKRKRGWDSSTLTSLKYSSLALTVLTWLLCSCVIGTSSTSTSPFVSNDEYPKFNLNDLANLMDMFPEFREYVLKTLSNYAEPQPGLNTASLAIPTSTIKPYQRSIVQPNIDSYSEQSYSKKDVQQQERKAATALDKHSYGYGHYDDYQPQPIKGHGYDKGYVKGYDHGWSGWSSKPEYHPQPTKGHGYDKGYGYDNSHNHGWSGWKSKPEYHPHHHHHDLQPAKGHGYEKGYDYGANHGWSGWSSDHHHELYKDPHYHYQVGYELGKDVSCVLGLLGFKSWKDFTFHSVFAVLKKLKYIVLIGLAFKLGVILSPVALPLLFPVIIIGAIIKILPLLLIIKLLFKLLKTQLKLAKLGKLKGRETYWERDDNGDDVPPLLEGTQLSRLWNSIEEATETVMDSESCMEKVICKIRQRQAQKHNETAVAEEEFEGRTFIDPTKNSFVQLTTFLLSRVMDWFSSARTSRGAIHKGDNDEIIFDCEKIPCSIVDI